MRFRPSLGAHGSDEPWRQPAWRSAFRRLHSDGVAVARFELGLVPTNDAWSESHSAEDAILAALDIPVSFPTAGGPSERPLWQIPDAATALYRRSTSRMNGAAPAGASWWCQSGGIGVLVETELDPRVSTPAAIVSSLDEHGIELYHWTMMRGKTPIDVWVIRHDDRAPDVLRKLRIHLLRLHAEWEVMRRVLNNVARGDRLPIEPRTDHTDRLLSYLNERTGLLLERRTLGLPSNELFQAAYGFDEMVHEGDLATLRAQLSTVMPNVLRKVERLAATPAAIQRLRVLMFQANPRGTPTLNLGAEHRAINDALFGSPLRDRFVLDPIQAARVEDLQARCLRLDPHVVHISAHGDPEGRILLHGADDAPAPVPSEALADLFGHAGSSVRCVVLSACGSASAASAICQNVATAIGTDRKLPDTTARAFAAGFYLGLGSGQNVDAAFGLGCNQASLERRDPAATLTARPGVDPATVLFDI